MRSAPSQRAQFAAIILLVDDNFDGIIARSSVLCELGYQVVTASSANGALELLNTAPVDLIITDYKMDDMNGLEFISAVRKRGLKTPMILLTGFAEALGLSPESTGADVVVQKSSNELTVLLRHAKRLLQPARKPARSHGSGKLNSRSHTAGS